MIFYKGIIYKNKIPHLILENNLGNFIEIPIDSVHADRISKYLNKICLPENKVIERGNDEESF